MSTQKKRKELTNNEIATFCSQFSMMISAGITISESLRLIQSDSEDSEGKEIISDILFHLDNGENLYQSMSTPRVFPKYVLDMIHVGEQTGNLDHVFTSLANYYEREENISRGIKTAVTYPFIMIAMMICVILVLIMKVLPIFEQVFNQLGSTMTGFSGSIMKIGTTLSKYSFIFIGIFVSIILCYIFLTHSNAGKTKLADFASGFVLTRDLYESIAAGRFASGMALALGSGFNPEQGIDMIYELISSKYYLKKLDLCRVHLQSGDHFADAVIKSNLFTNSYGRMISIGFKTGKLDDVMNKVASQYENDVDYKISHYVSILEPTLVAILSIIVGMILLSVMLPLMGIMSSIG